MSTKKANRIRLWGCTTTVSNRGGSIFTLSRRGSAEPMMTSARRKCAVSRTIRSFPSLVLKRLQASLPLSLEQPPVNSQNARLQVCHQQ